MYAFIILRCLNLATSEDYQDFKSFLMDTIPC